jgi:hypothetical protein
MHKSGQQPSGKLAPTITEKVVKERICLLKGAIPADDAWKIARNSGRGFRFRRFGPAHAAAVAGPN